jgi:hypothetical protein
MRSVPKIVRTRTRSSSNAADVNQQFKYADASTC